ncbi:lamin tail domain-containing protein [Chondromyces apiculatus]|uniref:LTD domain-containing protein n=1 Tax=Chondromyces apiculatus DSM 436 TaxID=1192034 RepID=A0A017TD46_9BACT|nr:lamin tail domain-containing protein [Chondromyces apiculatus]EYF06740.1 Hypothetical protein CAP_1437 [Chondromyces apiculatus DSM 436]
MSRRQRFHISWLAPLVLASCALPVEEAPEPRAEDFAQAVSVPSRGSASTLDVATWNLEWFGVTDMGPANEALQLQNARDVILGADLDIWAVQEISGSSHFADLLDALPGYDGFLSNDPSVASGSSYYYSSEQKVGIVYKTSTVTVNSAKIIVTAANNDFAGRPPLEVRLTVNVNGAVSDLVLITLHAKANSDLDSYTRRGSASVALKSYLDTTFPTQRVIVLGDFNDDVDTSIRTGQPSPYANFVADTADYSFVTKILSDTGKHSTVTGTQMLDHHLLTNELAQLLVSGSPQVYEVDQYVPSYAATTSNHYPVLARYTAPGAPPAPGAKVFLNEILANEPGSSTSGEFVEIVNGGASSVALGGYTLSDASGLRHTFPAGTTLGAGKALAVFGSAAGIPVGVTNAVAASTGGLSLNNGTDSVILASPAGTVVDTIVYTSALASTDGVSMNRSPDGSATGTVVLHTTLNAALASPGKRVNGAAF